MNLRETSGKSLSFIFRIWRGFLGIVPGGRLSAFGSGDRQIGKILIVNLDRQHLRLHRTLRELKRFRTSEGASLVSLAQRMEAVDARNGRDVAATADVDPTYHLSNQLYVQPDERLEECFSSKELIRMTKQEVAIARSHIEAWKNIATGAHNHVLILEDDVWFRPGAATMIDRGWHAAVGRSAAISGPQMLYLSYDDVGGAIARSDACDAVFRPRRGLWFLSGYVLSRDGAKSLLRSMPVVGPVDMWMNYRFEELGVLALCTPAILQRPDGGSDNSNSILPYLARAGIVDANAAEAPLKSAGVPTLAWTNDDENSRESLAMALSMLGLRVRVFDDNADKISEDELEYQLRTFDALVDAPLTVAAVTAATDRMGARFILEEGANPTREIHNAPSDRTVILCSRKSQDNMWQPLCKLLDAVVPAEAFPIGPPREWKVFRDGRETPKKSSESNISKSTEKVDDSAWALLPSNNWPSKLLSNHKIFSSNVCILKVPLTIATSVFPERTETFPGNLAVFEPGGLAYGQHGTEIICSKAKLGTRRLYRSGALASAQEFSHGRFQAEIKAARGPGLVTGFFLHRDCPRQEIDVEFTGDDPCTMLVNVYFNPGDDGTAFNYGYRGSPCRIELGFDASEDFHLYTIDWRKDCITWAVDGRIVHQRFSWDPTPIPHLPMYLHTNLWAPRSEELAGRIDESILPSSAKFRNVSVWI